MRGQLELWRSSCKGKRQKWLLWAISWGWESCLRSVKRKSIWAWHNQCYGSWMVAQGQYYLLNIQSGNRQSVSIQALLRGWGLQTCIGRFRSSYHFPWRWNPKRVTKLVLWFSFSSSYAQALTCSCPSWTITHTFQNCWYIPFLAMQSRHWIYDGTREYLLNYRLTVQPSFSHTGTCICTQKNTQNISPYS